MFYLYHCRSIYFLLAYYCLDHYVVAHIYFVNHLFIDAFCRKCFLIAHVNSSIDRADYPIFCS